MQLTLAALTQTMSEAKVLDWLRQEGQPVKKGDLLLVVETDKAAVEIQAPASGVLGRVQARVGDVVPVGGLLCVIQEEGEPADAQEKAKPAGAPAGADEKVRVSPLARKLAREHGLELAGLRGTGPGGRIVQEDVLAALKGAGNAPSAEAPPVSAPRAGMRRAIAQQMALSARTAARVTLFMEVDMSEAVALREGLAPRFMTQHQVRLSSTHLIIAATAHALGEHPYMNARWTDENVHLIPETNIGVAVALEDGLVVPVLRGAASLTLLGVAQAEARLVERAKAGTLSAEEFSGGTFTVTNLGMYGVDGFTPIINPPEAAILGVGRLAQKPAVRDGQIVPRWLMELCLSFDHRMVDGAPAAAFLGRIKELLEQPELLPAK